RLAHPNVVTVYEVGVHAEEIFLAMEYIEGGSTLGAWLKAAPRPPRAILGVMSAAGRGLAAAHAAGLVHRDVKPDNIIIDSNGRVRVVDFGLVRATTPREGSGLTPLTGTSVILGTPAYMSPEQIRGEPLTASSDLYSFCMVLYEALVGERPVGSGQGSELGLICGSRGGKKVPDRWLRVLARGLARQPSTRYPTMAALLEALRWERPRIRHEVLIRLLIAGLGLALVLLMAILWRMAERRLELSKERPVVLWSQGQMLRGDATGVVSLWDLVDDRPRESREQCARAPIAALAHSGSSGIVAALDQDGQLCIWRWRGGVFDALQPPPRRPGSVALAVDPSGKNLAIGDRRGRIWEYRVDSEELLQQWSVGGNIASLRFLGPDRLLVVTATGAVHRLRLMSTVESLR
ncbi:MAG TPA: hypothetical protein ENK31_06080, partial [Nannocystis exedens]|nr:hypothetical protein [Nannocystis exedens]